MTGIRAFLSAWPYTTSRSLAPFERAVLMKSCRSTSSIVDRVIRAMLPAECVPSVAIGST